MKTFYYIAIFLTLCIITVSGASEFVPEKPSFTAPRSQSTTGPIPPKGVKPKKPDTLELKATDKIITGVPGYAWRHGCGPTAVGMVMGYYDTHGYDNLIPGNASTQTEDVNQAIASQNNQANPRHYEDYSLPLDSETTSTTILPDKSEAPPGDEHSSDCIADFMHTSFSSDFNRYGWSWANMIATAWYDYIMLYAPGYGPSYENFHSGNPLTWEILKTEIDNNRPMVLLVDTDADGVTDHFVTAIGYRTTLGYQQYACLDTWAPAETPRWERFNSIKPGTPWGIWGGTRFWLTAPTPTPTPTPLVPIYVKADYPTISDALDAAVNGDEIIVEPGAYLENISFEGKNILLRSLNPTSPCIVARTIIDGDHKLPVVMFNGDETEECIISGFTIRNGYNIITGGGILGNHTHATVKNNFIIHNESHIEIFGPSSAMGGEGGGVHQCHGIIENNIIAYNKSFGIDAPDVQTDGRGAGLYNCNGIIRNNLILENTVEEKGKGGGLASCDGILENNVIYGNIAPDSGGGLAECLGSIKNCIIWENNAPSFAQLDDATSIPLYSCIQSWSGGGTGNISDPPGFIYPEAGIFYLDNSSPCIDKGDPDSRYNDGCLPPGKGSARNDMGAYGGPNNCFSLFQPQKTALIDHILNRFSMPHQIVPIFDMNQDEVLDVSDLVLFLKQEL